MRVFIEQTTNKNILKFVCDELLSSGSFELDVSSDLSKFPLAAQLLQFPFVQKIYISTNFVAVQKTDIVEWEDVAQELKEIVNEHLQSDTIIIKEQVKIPYTLYAEMTPNPLVMRFVSNQLLSDKMVEVKGLENAKQVPLAESILSEFEQVGEVFISENYVSITVKEQLDWQLFALELRQFILTYLQSGKELINDDYTPVKDKNIEIIEQKEYTDVEKEIKRILKEYVQPAVANDGGNIALLEFDEESKTAKMLLQGACSGCPSSTITLKNGIEGILKEMMPNVVENVIAVNG